MMFQRMLQVVAKVPKGKVATYGQIAKLAGYPGAARQVAWALHGSRGVPWHRVLGSGGKILLDGQFGMEQRMRLEMEGVTFNGLRAEIKKFAWEPGGQKKSAGKKSVGSKRSRRAR
jgi:methylated-DNA-protein-cysteine methyltransferase related protein